MAAWQAAAIALAIGLLIGSERERSTPAESMPAGLRTFALAGLAGAGAALVHPLVLAGLVAAAAVIMGAAHLRPDSPRSGATTEVALVLTVVLGGLTVSYPALAAGAGVATAVLLLAKDRMHAFVRDKITELEVGDALKFFVAAFIVLPLMPHASLGPYGVVDPRRIWTFVVAVTALGWLGYVAVRLLGPKRGLPVAGLAGGFISGAATTGAMARTVTRSQAVPAGDGGGPAGERRHAGAAGARHRGRRHARRRPADPGRRAGLGGAGRGGGLADPAGRPGRRPGQPGPGPGSGRRRWSRWRRPGRPWWPSTSAPRHPPRWSPPSRRKRRTRRAGPPASRGRSSGAARSR